MKSRRDIVWPYNEVDDIKQRWEGEESDWVFNAIASICIFLLGAIFTLAAFIAFGGNYG